MSRFSESVRGVRVRHALLSISTPDRAPHPLGSKGPWGVHVGCHAFHSLLRAFDM